MRTERKMSQADLAREVHVHPDQIAKVEKATRWPTGDLASSCDAALDSNGRLAALWPDVARQRAENLQRPRISVAADANHAVGVLEPIGAVARRLWRSGNTEAAVSTLDVGIADIVERYEVEDPAVLAPETVILRRDIESIMQYRPSTSQGRLLLGLAGRASAMLAYMAVNLGRFGHADAYSIEAHALAKAAGDRGLLAWVRGTQSFASYYRRDYATAVEYAHDGLRIVGDGPQAIRLKVNCEARALAYLPGRKREAEQAVTRASKLADQLDVPAGLSPCISFAPYSRGRVMANAITVFQTIGEAALALELVNDIQATARNSNSAWSRSLIDLDHASTLLHAPSPDIEQAMHLACAALVASADRPITSVVERSLALDRAVEPNSTLPAVRDFREQLHIVVAARNMRRHDARQLGAASVTN